MEEKSQDLDAKELRAIIQGLKLSGLSNVEEDAVGDLQFLINDLPSAEEMDSIASNPLARQNVAKQIGEIMNLIETYSKRKGEYKSRFQAKRKMPPRYKVLEWRPQMQANRVEGLVRLSSKFDDIGQGEISKDLIVLANKAIQNELKDSDFYALNAKLEKSGFYNNDPIFQEAGLPRPSEWWAEQKGKMKGGYDAVKDLAHQISDPAKAEGIRARSVKSIQNILKELGTLDTSLNETLEYVYRNPTISANVQKIITDINSFQKTLVATQDTLTQMNMKEAVTPTGTPAAGTPSAVTPTGTPAAVTPTGTPAAVTPAGTPAAGTPAAGTPASGTVDIPDIPGRPSGFEGMTADDAQELLRLLASRSIKKSLGVKVSQVSQVDINPMGGKMNVTTPAAASTPAASSTTNAESATNDAPATIPELKTIREWVAAIKNNPEWLDAVKAKLNEIIGAQQQSDQNADIPQVPDGAPEPTSAEQQSDQNAESVAPNGAPKPTSPEEAANFVQFLKSKGVIAKNKKNIRVAKRSNVAFTQWYEANKNDADVLKQALQYYQSKAGSAKPSIAPTVNVRGSEVGQPIPVSDKSKPVEKAPAAKKVPLGKVPFQASEENMEEVKQAILDSGQDISEDLRYNFVSSLDELEYDQLMTIIDKYHITMAKRKALVKTAKDSRKWVRVL